MLKSTTPEEAEGAAGDLLTELRERGFLPLSHITAGYDKAGNAYLEVGLDAEVDLDAKLPRNFHGVSVRRRRARRAVLALTDRTASAAV